MKLETSEEERASKFAEAIKRVGQIRELPDSIRLPLHSLKADTRYLTGRVAIEGESIKAHVDDSILTRLSQIETAVYGILADRAPPLPAEETVARCVEAVRREYPASVSEPYTGTPAITLDAGAKPVDLDDLVRIVLAAAPPAPPLPAEVEETASTLRWLSGDDSGKFTNGDKSVLLRASSLLSRWPGLTLISDAPEGVTLDADPGAAKMSLDVYLHLQTPPTAPDIEVYSDNITHNLAKMADAAGIYYALWRPEEIGITTARQLSELLQDGYSRLLSSPETYRAFDAPNGWGKYDDFVRFVMNYISACEQYPEALVSVSR